MRPTSLELVASISSVAPAVRLTSTRGVCNLRDGNERCLSRLGAGSFPAAIPSSKLPAFTRLAFGDICGSMSAPLFLFFAFSQAVKLFFSFGSADWATGNTGKVQFPRGQVSCNSNCTLLGCANRDLESSVFYFCQFCAVFSLLVFRTRLLNTPTLAQGVLLFPILLFSCFPFWEKKACLSCFSPGHVQSRQRLGN